MSTTESLYYFVHINVFWKYPYKYNNNNAKSHEYEELHFLSTYDMKAALHASLLWPLPEWWCHTHTKRAGKDLLPNHETFGESKAGSSSPCSDTGLVSSLCWKWGRIKVPMCRWRVWLKSPLTPNGASGFVTIIPRFGILGKEGAITHQNLESNYYISFI